MMEYITYAHLLHGQVFQIGDFGAVALWYLFITTYIFYLWLIQDATWSTYG